MASSTDTVEAAPFVEEEGFVLAWPMPVDLPVTVIQQACVCVFMCIKYDSIKEYLHYIYSKKRKATKMTR